MRLTDPDRVLLERLGSDEFVLRPVTVDDAEADHAAVMDAQTQLRLWSQSDWPADDFTVEENRADLLAMQHRSRSTATRRLEASTIALPPRSRAARYPAGPRSTTSPRRASPDPSLGRCRSFDRPGRVGRLSPAGEPGVAPKLHLCQSAAKR